MEDAYPPGFDPKIIDAAPKNSQPSMSSKKNAAKNDVSIDEIDEGHEEFVPRHK